MSGIGFLLFKMTKKSQAPCVSVLGILLWPRLDGDTREMLDTVLKSGQWFRVYRTQPHSNESDEDVEQVSCLDYFWLALEDQLFVA